MKEKIKERDAYKGTKKGQDTKEIVSEKKIYIVNNNQKIRCTKQRENGTNCKRKDQVTYKGLSIRITPDISIETQKARISGQDLLQILNRPWIPNQAMISSKALSHHRQRK